MKVRTLVAAGAMLTAATSFAFAQSSPSPANQSGGGVTKTQSQPTDQGLSGTSGNTKGSPSGAAMQRQPAPSGTTGMSPGASQRESMEKNTSPSSPQEGIKQEK